MTHAIVPEQRPALDLQKARALLSARGVTEQVALLGVRGFFGEMGHAPGNEIGLYDDAVFLVTPEACTGFIFNTDPSKSAPSDVMLKPGLWRYRRGWHNGSERHEALVHEGSPVWVVARPVSLEDYHHFAGKVGQRRLDSVAAYREALRAGPGKVMDDGTVEWPMDAHINVHRGGVEGTSSKGCQTVPPDMWAEFIGATYGAMERHRQPEIPYLLVEAQALEARPADR